MLTVKKILMAVFIGLVVIGAVTVIASIVVPMLSTPTASEESVALIGLTAEQAQELYNDLYGLDNHGLWTALGIAGGIVLLIGAVPLILMAVLKKVK